MEVLKHLKIQKAQEHTNSLATLNQTSVLTSEQQVILRKKYASSKIGKLNEVEFIVFSKKLLLQISVITGWALPTAEILNVLIDQFQKKLIEDYSGLNVDEIEYAFRRATNIEDWGKELNLNLIDKVLKPYKEERFEASKIEEQKAPIPEKRPYDPNEVLNLYRSQIEEYFQALKKGYNPIRHKYYEETLREDGMIPENENMDEFLVRKLATANNLYLKEKYV
jgi:hypothetical protein